MGLTPRSSGRAENGRGSAISFGVRAPLNANVRLANPSLEPQMQNDQAHWPLIVANRQGGTAEGDDRLVFEMYKEYLKTAYEWDRAAIDSEKFFSALSLAILSGFVLVLKEKIELPLPLLLSVLAASIWLSVTWILTNISYAKAVSVKMEVAQEIEELLPLRPLKYEWEEKFRKIGYIRISRIQRIFPVMFILLYIAIGVSMLHQGPH